MPQKNKNSNKLRPKKTKRKKSIKYKLSEKKYKELIKKKQKKSISKKNNNILEEELNKKYCKCIKTFFIFSLTVFIYTFYTVFTSLSTNIKLP